MGDSPVFVVPAKGGITNVLRAVYPAVISVKLCISDGLEQS